MCAQANVRAGGVWVWTAVFVHAPLSSIIGKLHGDRRKIQMATP
jgi:hypothetical protein